MTSPLLGPTFHLHAWANIAANGTIIASVNVVQVEKEEIGEYIITLGTGVGVEQRHISLTRKEEATVIYLDDLEGEQDTAEEFHVFIEDEGEGLNPADKDFEVCVFRTTTTE